MSTQETGTAVEDPGSYIKIGGVKRKVKPHETDFAVDVGEDALTTLIPESDEYSVKALAVGRSRVSVKDSNPDVVKKLITEARKDLDRGVHHIYVLDTGHEISITDTIYLTLTEANPGLARAIADEYKLDIQSERDNVYVLKVSRANRRSPLKIANEVAAKPGVLSCTPKVLFPIRFEESATGRPADAGAFPELFEKQWHLMSAEGELLDPLASINVTKAWEVAEGRGNSDVVIAVIDDGFDLPEQAALPRRHDAFKETIIDTDNMKNFGDGGEPNKRIESRGKDSHGTSVASIISAVGDGMLGVAPGCKLLPVRIGRQLTIDPEVLLKVIGSVAGVADVVNCSFSMTPNSFPLILNPPTFIDDLRRLVTEGGRRPGKGLIIVFSAGNDDAPISRAEGGGVSIVQNVGTQLKSVTVGPPVHCGFSELSGSAIPGGPVPGVVVVGSASSLRRRAGYSNWGEELTVTAPSDNGNENVKLELTSQTNAGQTLRERFPGLGVVAAINRLGNGDIPPDLRIPNDPSTRIDEHFLYTDRFGGTSAAAAIVTGVIGLMLSVNPNLTATEVSDILKETAARDMDQNKLTDFESDPNLVGVNGRFENKRSLFFGSGIVNAEAAVLLAKKKLQP